jgi:hypothetical protein
MMSWPIIARIDLVEGFQLVVKASAGCPFPAAIRP